MAAAADAADAVAAAATPAPRLLLFGGINATSTLPLVPPTQQYIPATSTSTGTGTAAAAATNAWTLLQANPLANVANASAAVLNQLVYVTGGATPPFGSPRSTVLAFAREKNEWINIAPMNVARQMHCSFVAGGTLFVIGGGTDVTEAFDPETDSWTEKQRMPQPLTGMSCTLVNDTQLFVIGGMFSNGTLNTQVLLYDTATDLWSAAPVP